MSKKLKKVNKFSSSDLLGERVEMKLSKAKSVGKIKKVDDEIKKEIIKKKPMKKKSKENASGENVKVLRKKPEAPPSKAKLKNVKSNPEMKIRKTRKKKENKGAKEAKSCTDLHFDRLATSFSYESFKHFEIEHDFDFDPFEDEEFRRNLFRTDLVWKGSKYKKRVSRSPILSEIDEEPDEQEYSNEKNDKRVFKRGQHNFVPMSKKMSRKIKK